MKLVDKLIAGIESQDIRSIARAISLVEDSVIENDGLRDVLYLMERLYPKGGRASIVGVTGAPGSGKSTLVDVLALEFAKVGKKVAVLAIDPTSPFTGGAILGDRIRMMRSLENPQIFMRSMATRGALGGLARATYEALTVLDAAGYDLILVETVGVGQVEVDVVRTVDTCMVVLVPGMGDAVQTFKAGIIEIADLFVINKADREGADLVQRDLNLLLSLANYSDASWKPPIQQTVATEAKGVAALLDSIQKHTQWLKSSSEGADRRRRIIKEAILRGAGEQLLARAMQNQESLLTQLVEKCLERKLDPISASLRLSDRT